MANCSSRTLCAIPLTKRLHQYLHRYMANPLVPHQGYKALGCVVSSTLDTKPTDRTDIMCVFGSCTCPASVETDALWSYARARGKSTSSSSSSNVSQLISIWRSKASSQCVDPYQIQLDPIRFD